MEEAMTILKGGANVSLPSNVYSMWIFMENLNIALNPISKFRIWISHSIQNGGYVQILARSQQWYGSPSVNSLSTEINMTHLNGMALSPRTPTKHQRSCAWTLHSRHSNASQSERDVVIWPRQSREIHECIAKPRYFMLIASTLVPRYNLFNHHDTSREPVLHPQPICDQNNVSTGTLLIFRTTFTLLFNLASPAQKLNDHVKFESVN